MIGDLLNLPTLDDLSSSKVVIISHQSRPGKLDFTSTEPHSKLLSKLIGRKVDFVPDVCGELAIGAIKSMRDGDILFLNNVRMMDEENMMKKSSQEVLATSQIVRNLLCGSQTHMLLMHSQHPTEALLPLLDSQMRFLVLQAG